MNDKKNTLLKNAVLNVIKTAMTTMFPVITYMYVARIFGTSGMGQLGFSKSIIIYFQLFSMLGIVNYGTSVIASYKTNEYEVSENSKSLLLINIVSMSIAYAVFIICVIKIPELSNYKILLLIYSSQIILQVIGMEWLYLGLEEFKYITIRTIIIQVISLVSMFTFIHRKEDIYIYAVIQVLSAAGANLFNFVHARRYIFNKNTHIKPVKKHIKPIITIFLMTLFANLFTQLDTSMLGFMSGDDAVGLYSAGDKLSSMISGLIGAISMVILPRIAFYNKNGNEDEITKTLIDVVNIITMLSIPISIAIFIYSKYIILWLSGEAFLSAILTTKMLSIRVLIAPVNALFTLYYFIPIKKEKRSLLVTGIAAILNLCLNLILIPIISYNGAAIATVTAEIVELVIIALLIKRDSINCHLLLKSVLQYFVGAGGVLFTCTIINFFIENMYAEFVVGIVISVISYFSVLILMKNHYVQIIKKRLWKKQGKREK